MNKFAQLGADIAKLWLKYGNSYFGGIKNTLILALVGTVIGCLIGFICGILNTIPYSRNDNPVKRFFLALIRVIIRIYVEVFRGTPMVLQAVFLYYGLPYFTNNSVKFTSVWAAAIVVVSINTGAYMAESVRGGIISVDPGQTEGAKAIGMTHVQTYCCTYASKVIFARRFPPAMPAQQLYRSRTTAQFSSFRFRCLTASRISLPLTGQPLEQAICISRPRR